MIGTILGGTWLREPRFRRPIILVGIIIAALLSLFPRQYLAEAELLPQDSGGGLAAALAQGTGSSIMNLGALIGNKQPVEADLTIARSELVLNNVLNRMHILGHPGFETRDKALNYLRSRIEIVSIRGSILQISVRDRDASFARLLAAATADAIQDRLTALNIEQTTEKRRVANNRVQAATEQLILAQAALEKFRVAHHLGAPEQQLGVAVGLLASLQAQVQAKQIEIASLERFEGPDNIRLKSAQVELAALRQHAADAEVAADRNSTNLAFMATENAEYFNLYRDEKAAEALYEVYRKYMEQVTIDTLSANQNMVLMQPAFIHPERQFNTAAVGLLAILVMLGVAAEFYIVTPPVRGRFQ